MEGPDHRRGDPDGRAHARLAGRGPVGAPEEADHHHLGPREEAGRQVQPPQVRVGRLDARPGHFHAPVRHDDQRGTYAGAVPGHPFEADGEGALPERHRAGHARGRSRQHAGRVAVEEGKPAGLRRAVREHGRGWRGGRYPGRHPLAAGHVHREGRGTQAEGQGRHGLSGRGHGRGHSGHVLHAHLHHPDLRPDVHRIRRRASPSDQDRHGPLVLPPVVLVDAGRRTDHVRRRAAALLPDRPRPDRDRPAAAQGPRARGRHPEGRRRALHAHPGDADLVGRAHPHRPRDHRPDVGKSRDPGSHHGRARQHPRGRDDLGAPARLERLPADGRADDLRGRGDRRAGRHAHAHRGLLRRRSRHGRGIADLADRADHDRLHGQRRGRHGGRHVPPDVQADQRGRGRKLTRPMQPARPIVGAGEDEALRREVGAVIVGRIALITLATVMAAAFSDAITEPAQNVPLLFLVALSAGLAVAYHRAAGSGTALASLLAMQLIVDVAVISYLLLFTGGASSPFVPLYLLAPLLGGIFLSRRGGMMLAGAAAVAYAVLYATERGGMLPPVSYGLTERLSESALKLRLVLYLPLLFVVGAIGGALGRTLREGRRALDEARAELSRALFDTETILENLSSGLATIDAQGIVRHWNRAAAEILRKPVDGVRGRHYEALGEGFEEFTARLRETLASGVPAARHEARVRT